MFRSGCILILAILSPRVARATGFDYARFVGADVRVCESNLTVEHRPTIEQPLGRYVENLSTLKYEPDFYLAVSRGANGGNLNTLLQPSLSSGDIDLVTMRRMSLDLVVVKNQLGLYFGSSLIYLLPFTEPVHGLRVTRESSTTGYVTLLGWTRSLTLRLKDGRLFPADESPFDPPARSPVTPLREHEDPEVEIARLATHATRAPYSGALKHSVLREALGELAERTLERASAICRGEAVRGGLIGGPYPNSLLGLAALALAGDVATRAMVADGINEHPDAAWTMRAANDSNYGSPPHAGSLVFTMHAPACPTLYFVVPDDPFVNADGWGYLR